MQPKNQIEVVGGFCIKDVAEGRGTVLEVKESNDSVDEDINDLLDYEQGIQSHLNTECIKNGYDSEEPFNSLAKNMHNLLTDGKIKKRILRNGYGEKPVPSANVKIHYNAYVEHEVQPFDSTYGRKNPFSFIVGQEEVIEGLDIAVQSMYLNEKSQFLIDPELAYRSSGLNRIPPNSQVLFEVELCEVRTQIAKNESKIEERSFSNVYNIALEGVVRGKNMFRLKDFRGAIREYKIAVDKLEGSLLSNYNEQLKCEELLVRLYTNLLICSVQENLPKKGCVFAQKIFEMSRNKTFHVSCKVFFNHAKCLRLLGNYEIAQRKLKAAQRLEPQNADVHAEIAALDKAIKEDKKRQATFGKALLNR